MQLKFVVIDVNRKKKSLAILIEREWIRIDPSST